MTLYISVLNVAERLRLDRTIEDCGEQLEWTED